MEKGTPFGRSLSLQAIIRSTPLGHRKGINLITANSAFIGHKAWRVSSKTYNVLSALSEMANGFDNVV